MSTASTRRPYRMVARAERREQTRTRIVAAMEEAVVSEPFPAIRVADVAAAAGVSAQTVHTHFASKEELFLAAVGGLGQELLHRRAAVAPGDVEALVRCLVTEYERLGDAGWGLLPLERESEAVAEALRTGRASHRAWLEEALDPLLPDDGARRRRALDAAYAATDVGTWKLLRRDLGLSRPRTRAAMGLLLRGALTSAGEAGG